MIQQSFVRVDRSEIAGNGLFATKALGPGELVLKLSRPLVTILDTDHLPVKCAECVRGTQHRAGVTAEADLVPSDKLNFCGGCRQVKYCSKPCQTRSWKRSHKYECKLFKLRDCSSLPTTARSAIQMLVMVKNETLTDEERAGIMRLTSFEIQDDKDELGEMGLIARLVASLIKRDLKNANTTLAEVREMIFKVTTNGFAFVTEAAESLGSSVDPIISTLNHSCDPNCVVIFDGLSPSVRTIRSIAKDEEVTWCYIDATRPWDMRRWRLRTRYGFLCECSKCRNATATERKPPTMLEMEYSSAYQTSEKMKDPAAAKEFLRAVVGKALAIMPITQQPIPDLLLALAARCNQTGEWITSLIIFVKIYWIIDPALYPQPSYVTRVVHLWILILLLKNITTTYFDAGKKEEFTRDFGMQSPIVPMMRLVLEMRSSVRKSHGEGALMRAADEMYELGLRIAGTTAAEMRQFVDADPDGDWKQFEKLKDRPLDPSPPRP